MHEFVPLLADAVKRARGRLNLTQEQAAELAHTDVTTIMKMENVKRNANPELATLWHVIRALEIDSNEIFNPGLSSENPRIQLLQQIISDCTDREADALIPIVKELIRFMRENGKSKIEE